MQLWELFVIAVGLSMDAFAVSICKGLSVQRLRWSHALTAGAWFGAFQALMPLAGWLLGTRFEGLITNVDHWVAFVLLVLIGGNMVKESRGACEALDASFAVRAMFPLAVATSIDALAVGASLAVMPQTGLLAYTWGFLVCCGVIAAVTFIICFAGVKIGCRTGNLFGKKAEIVGGIVLIAIGLKILLEHLGAFEAIAGWLA